MMGRSDRSDPGDLDQAGPRGGNGGPDPLLRCPHLGFEPGDVVYQFGGDHHPLAGHLVGDVHLLEQRIGLVDGHF